MNPQCQSHSCPSMALPLNIDEACLPAACLRCHCLPIGQAGRLGVFLDKTVTISQDLSGRWCQRNRGLCLHCKGALWLFLVWLVAELLTILSVPSRTLMGPRPRGEGQSVLVSSHPLARSCSCATSWWPVASVPSAAGLSSQASWLPGACFLLLGF